MEAEEVASVKAVEDTISFRGELEMLDIRPLDDAHFLCCNHITPPRP